MAERKYSVAEIDALREIMERKYSFGFYFYGESYGRNIQGRSYIEADKIRTVEEWVRTAMLAGLTVDDYIEHHNASQVAARPAAPDDSN